MSRYIYACTVVDEERLNEVCDENDTGPLDEFEMEMIPLSKSGVYLDTARVLDTDCTLYESYLIYLMDFALNADVVHGGSPMSFEAWLKTVF